MFNKFIAGFTLLLVFGTASAEEAQSRLALDVGGKRYSQELRDPIVWKPVTNGLTKYTLTLPKQGIEKAIQYRDTASLFYLSRVNDDGLSLKKYADGFFDFRLTPKLSRVHYRHPLSQSWSLNIGAKLEQDDIFPLVGGEFRSITSASALLHSSVNLSNSKVGGFISHTKLNERENLEKIWAISLNANQSRFAYGLRWFNFIKEEDILVEFGLNNKDPLFGFQLERSFNATTAYVGILTQLNSKKAQAFLGMKFEFSNNTNVKLESENSLISGSAQSLGTLRRAALPSLWRSRISITDQ